MILVIALAVWALASLPIAIALGRLCSTIEEKPTEDRAVRNPRNAEPSRLVSV